jgi:TRAP transporter 4TM/12TM fusion protein
VTFSLLFLAASASSRFIPTEAKRSLYLMFNVMLAIMLYPPSRGRGGQKKIPLYDYALIGLSVVTFVYWLVTYRHFATVARGMANQVDFYMGIICLLLLIESARRVLGPILLGVGLIFMLQLYFGPYMPGTFAHRGFSVFRIVEFLYRTTDGVFGSIAATFSTYVLPFIIMGAFLEVSGAGDFFIKLSLSLTKGWAGGPAKVAVIASAIFGSISGSSVANVVATGTFTIPMMKRVGFEPEHAGAIEAAASTGGQFLPPVMGAGAFLLATLTETPYVTVAKMNVLPALLYFFWVGCVVHFHAKKFGIGSLPDEEIPGVWATLKEGWFFIVPIALIFVMLFSGQSVERSAFTATVSCVVLSWFTKNKKMKLRELGEALCGGGKSNISVGASIGMLGLVMGGITLAGMGQKFGMLVISLSGGKMFLGIALVGLVGAVIGMGATQTATYIIMSLIVVPGLVSLGIEPVVAHIIAFWFSAASNVTPPVCVSAFAAASIAGSNPMKTGLVGVKYSFMLFILPFTFAYFPEILLLGSARQVIYMAVCVVAGLILFAGGLEGFFLRSLGWLERLLMMTSALLLFIPEGITDVAGIVIAGVIILRQWRGVKAGVLGP